MLLPMKSIYLISGLGADERLFSFLNLPDHTLHFIKWARPVKNESIQEYAKRLLPQITDENPILLGVSFGGMLAIEISKLISVEKVILISSVKNYDEFSPLIKTAFRFRLHKLLFPIFISITAPVAYPFFRSPIKSARPLQWYFFSHPDTKLIKWAVGAMSKWRSGTVPKNIFHLQGSNDTILPAKYTSADIIIEEGTHFMIVERADQISEIISTHL